MCPLKFVSSLPKVFPIVCPMGTVVDDAERRKQYKAATWITLRYEVDLQEPVSNTIEGFYTHAQVWCIPLHESNQAYYCG